MIMSSSYLGYVTSSHPSHLLHHRANQQH
jgi:hypothetical protein